MSTEQLMNNIPSDILAKASSESTKFYFASESGVLFYFNGTDWEVIGSSNSSNDDDDDTGTTEIIIEELDDESDPVYVIGVDPESADLRYSSGVTMDNDGNIYATSYNDYVLADACSYNVTDLDYITEDDGNLVTARTVYNALPTINNSHGYTSSTNIYAPTSKADCEYSVAVYYEGYPPQWKTPVQFLGCLGSGLTSATQNSSTLTGAANLTSYNLVTGGLVFVTFKYDVPAGDVLNINSTGKIPIYYNANPIEDGVISAGSTVSLLYDGTNYNVLGIYNI